MLIVGLILISSLLLAFFLRQSPYKNCSIATAHGVYNIKRSSRLYNPRLDRDHDGYACER